MKESGRKLRHLAPLPWVTILGQLEDPTDVCGTARVIVNPMQLGTGPKIKSVEPLGLALVSTPCGAESVEDGSEIAIRVAVDPEAFAVEITTLLKEPSLSTRVRQVGAEYVCSSDHQIANEITKLLTPAD